MLVRINYWRRIKSNLDRNGIDFCDTMWHLLGFGVMSDTGLEFP